MKIKIIDLLNLVYEEKAPKMIRVKYGKIYEIYKYDEDLRWYQTLDETTLLHVLQRDLLGLEVEIIEERPKEISKIMLEKGNIEIGSIVNELEFPNHDLELLANCIEGMIMAWNESTDTFNYLLKKEDDDSGN